MRVSAFRKTWIKAIFVGMSLSACVTVNVNFPESAVQKATDDYVRDLYRAKEKGKTPGPEASATPQKKASLLSIVIPEAYAAEGDGSFRVNSEKSMAIRQKLASHLDDVLAQKRAGVLGESNEGMLVLKAPDKVKPLLKKKIDKIVEDENSARQDLYQEVLKSNGLPSSRLKDVQKSFARSFQAESPSGTWVQDMAGSWSQKQ